MIFFPDLKWETVDRARERTQTEFFYKCNQCHLKVSTGSIQSPWYLNKLTLSKGVPSLKLIGNSDECDKLCRVPNSIEHGFHIKNKFFWLNHFRQYQNVTVNYSEREKLLSIMKIEVDSNESILIQTNMEEFVKEKIMVNHVKGFCESNKNCTCKLARVKHWKPKPN